MFSRTSVKTVLLTVGTAAFFGLGSGMAQADVLGGLGDTGLSQVTDSAELSRLLEGDASRPAEAAANTLDYQSLPTPELSGFGDELGGLVGDGTVQDAVGGLPTETTLPAEELPSTDDLPATEDLPSTEELTGLSGPSTTVLQSDLNESAGVDTVGDLTEGVDVGGPQLNDLGLDGDELDRAVDSAASVDPGRVTAQPEPELPGEPGTPVSGGTGLHEAADLSSLTSGALGETPQGVLDSAQGLAPVQQ